LKQFLPRYALGFLILLVLLGHSAHIYQIPLVNRLDAIIYDAKIRLSMPQGIDQRVVILDIDEKSLAEQGRWPWGRDKLATLMDKLFDQYGVRLVGFDVVFAEPDESSGLKSLESMAKTELKDVAGFHSALRELRPQLDHDARFAAALKNRAVILGYYFSNAEGGVSSGAAAEPVFAAGTFSGKTVEMAVNNETTYAMGIGSMALAKKGAGGMWIADSLTAHANKVHVATLPYETKRLCQEIGGGIVETGCFPSAKDFNDP